MEETKEPDIETVKKELSKRKNTANIFSKNTGDGGKDFKNKYIERDKLIKKRRDQNKIARKTRRVNVLRSK